MNRVDIVIIAEPIISGKNADKVSRGWVMIMCLGWMR